MVERHQAARATAGGNNVSARGRSVGATSHGGTHIPKLHHVVVAARGPELACVGNTR